MIPYGSNRIETVDRETLSSFGLFESQYALVVARAEPDNSILEIVRALFLVDQKLPW